MFPIHIGINRVGNLYRNARYGVPYTHRDKPGIRLTRDTEVHVFPIHIGINRKNAVSIWEPVGVPYTHRDKPRELLTEIIRQ